MGQFREGKRYFIGIPSKAKEGGHRVLEWQLGDFNWKGGRKYSSTPNIS